MRSMLRSVLRESDVVSDSTVGTDTRISDVNPSKELKVVRLEPADDLDLLADQIESVDWDNANDMGDYSSDSLAAFAADPNRVFLVARNADQLVGVASADILLKPYEHELWLYVDEVDVVPSHRKQGVGKAMMRELRQVAEANGCVEMWLGTEHDNESALALYKSMNPDEVEPFVGFTWQIRRSED